MVLNDKDKLIYDIIFGTDTKYEIPFYEYIDLEEVDNFTDKIRENLLLSGIKIIEDNLILSEERNSWILKIER